MCEIIDLDRLKKEIHKVGGLSRQDFSTLTQDEMNQVLHNLGLTLTSYLSIEAYLYCKGGAKARGEGPF